jgi:ubiquinone/menaquinone biosynthesis C-methylase UbiE
MNDGAYFPATGMPDDDWWHALWPDPEGVLVKIGISPGQTVIDLCCGNGHFTTPLASLLGKKGHIFAVDMDSAMLNAARSRMEKSSDRDQIATIEWIETDARYLDLALEGKGEADALIIANTFHGVPDQQALSSAVARVLKPGGQFMIINWHDHPRDETTIGGKPRGPKTEMRMSPDDVARVVLPAGFALKEVVDLLPYHYGAVFNLA